MPFERGKIPGDGYIYAIHADRENALWIGGSSGLRRFKDGVLTGFTTADGLAGNDVKVIIEARAGGLWIGTYDGLTRLQNGQLTSWRETDGLPSRTVRALYEDADGTLWIGSYDGGLARFKDGKFTRYTTKTALPNDGAFQILEDDNRNFWISSNRGIYRVKKDELNDFADGRRATVTAIAYGKSDGMLNAECNGGRSPAGIRTRDGRLWFPTQDGVAVIDPREIKANSQPPPVVIETVKIDNELSEPPAVAGGLSRGSRALNSNESQTDVQPSATADGSDITIEPSQQNFEIGYTALSFINSENLQFKYKLEGLDDDWIDAGTRRLAYFSHVPPGGYTFRVIAANSDGVWNEQGATLKIVVLPPFYRTWWFITLAAIGIGILAYLLFRRRVAQINLKHAAELAFSRRLIDSQEQERKRLAAELHDGLGQNLVVIKNRALLGMRKGDDKERVMKEFDNISESATLAIEEVREITNNLRPHLLDRLGLTRSINAMLKKVSGVIEIESEIDSIDNIFSDAQEISVYRIVQESVNNVIKYSNASVAQVVIKPSANTLLITIEDDGTGFDFEATKSKSGFGLVGLKERTQLLNGEFSIDSKIGQGTKITVKIPVVN
ncbi:MAG: histidine kinase [Pyrinomonadaceae bacterium]|nr:histidine kinase [Pyrinomonadaceae bacterium]